MAKPDGEDGRNARSDSTRKQRWQDEIVSYLRLVQRTFENEPKKYHEFLRILVDRKHRRLSGDSKSSKDRKECFSFYLLYSMNTAKEGFFKIIVFVWITVAHLIEEVWSLFEGHDELINEFYQFLPKKYRGKDGTSLEDATNFVIKLKVKDLLKGPS